jgi:hypothetical protein
MTLPTTAMQKTTSMDRDAAYVAIRFSGAAERPLRQRRAGPP